MYTYVAVFKKHSEKPYIKRIIGLVKSTCYECINGFSVYYYERYCISCCVGYLYRRKQTEEPHIIVKYLTMDKHFHFILFILPFYLMYSVHKYFNVRRGDL